MPVTLQFGLMEIYQSGTFVVADSSLDIQIKYDGSHIAFILLLNATKVQCLWGNINGDEDDDLKKPEDEAVNATNYGWRWRVLQLEGQCAEDCGDASSVALLNSCRRCILSLVGFHFMKYPFNSCRKVIRSSKISAVVNVINLCSCDNVQKILS